jgi:hypothetical protein
VCSLTLNKTSKESIDSLRGESEAFIKKIRNRAFGAKIATQGLLDAPNTHLRHFPNDLRHVRKETIGRHRVYYFGHHTDCSYTVFYIKLNKRGDSWAQDDDNPQFQDKLRIALASETAVTYPDPDETQG